MFTATLKRCGRIQNVVINKYMNCFRTLEITDQKHINGFLKLAQTRYAAKKITPMACEFDVERMYPNIARERVLPAYRVFDVRLKKMETTTRLDHETYMCPLRKGTQIRCHGAMGGTALRCILHECVS